MPNFHDVLCEMRGMGIYMKFLKKINRGLILTVLAILAVAVYLVVK